MSQAQAVATTLTGQFRPKMREVFNYFPAYMFLKFQPNLANIMPGSRPPEVVGACLWKMIKGGVGALEGQIRISDQSRTNDIIDGLGKGLPNFKLGNALEDDDLEIVTASIGLLTRILWLPSAGDEATDGILTLDLRAEIEQVQARCENSILKLTRLSFGHVHPLIEPSWKSYSTTVGLMLTHKADRQNPIRADPVKLVRVRAMSTLIFIDGLLQLLLWADDPSYRAHYADGAAPWEIDLMRQIDPDLLPAAAFNNPAL